MVYILYSWLNLMKSLYKIFCVHIIYSSISENLKTFLALDRCALKKL